MRRDQGSKGAPRRPAPQPRGAPPEDTRGLRVVPRFVTPDERAQVLAWLATLRPLWEQRFSTRRPPPAGEAQRRLLRPVYWLGNWQFACLGYYTPPRGTVDRCVRAEPFPPPLRAWVERAESLVRRQLPPSFVPAGWALNTCLVNFYGDVAPPGGKREDRARVGDHRDHEPGPVASVSLGDRAFFQFTTRRGAVVRPMWLEDGMLQVISGPYWKDELFHRVQRVERKGDAPLPPLIPGFQTRRINFTFRYVPPAAVTPYARLGAEAQADVREYVEELAASSPFWAAALREADGG